MRLKDVAVMNALTLPETTSGEYSFRYIDIGSVSEDGKVTLDEPIRFDEAPSRARRIVKRNDVLISTVRTYLKAIAPVDFDATDVIASTGFAVCTPMKGTHPRYLAYAVRSDEVIDEICKESCGISYPAINSTKLSGIKITYCDAATQQQIVVYLDSRCAVIDRTVALLEQKRTAYGKLKRALINETVTRGLDKDVELNNSGNDRLKALSKNGRVRRLKDCATLNPNCDDASIVGDVSFVPMEALRWGKIDAQTIPIDQAKGKYTPFADGDLLVARVTPCFERGNIAIANGLLQGVGFGSSEIFVLRVNENAESKYMFYLTLTARFQDGACATMCGVGGLKRISPEFMRTYEIDLPLKAEQRRIADYLDRKCAAIDAAVENVTRQIELYRKLKRSLIDEVVTGRRKVA